MTLDWKDLAGEARETAIDAGLEILSHYRGPSPVGRKADDSPVTVADRAAHARIRSRLRSLAADIPVLSEEDAAHAPYEERVAWPRFWLVDPLDGTKEFMRGSADFTVNIALVEGRRPVIGVVHAPALERTYVAVRGHGVERTQPGEKKCVHSRRWQKESLRVVASRDHAGPWVSALVEHLGPVEQVNMGSSLKFCLVAEAQADLYFRDVPTMEWDTAAAQCVVEEAGGALLTLTGRPLRYNKLVLRNPLLVTVGDPQIPWREWLDAVGVTGGNGTNRRGQTES